MSRREGHPKGVRPRPPHARPPKKGEVAPKAGGSPAARRPPRDGPRLRPAPPRPQTPPAPARSWPLAVLGFERGKRKCALRAGGGGRGGRGGSGEARSPLRRLQTVGEAGGKISGAPWQQVYACVRGVDRKKRGESETASEGGRGGSGRKRTVSRKGRD